MMIQSSCQGAVILIGAQLEKDHVSYNYMYMYCTVYCTVYRISYTHIKACIVLCCIRDMNVLNT